MHFQPTLKDTAVFRVCQPRKTGINYSLPRTSAALDNLDRGKNLGPTMAHHFSYDWLLVVASPPKKKLDPKKGSCPSSMCLNRFKAGKACQTQWSLVACSGGGPSTTIMLRGLAVFQNGKHWTGGERSLDVQVCCRF